MQKKLIKIGSKVIVVLDGGSYYEAENVSDKTVQEIKNATTKEQILTLLNPTQVEEWKRVNTLRNSLTTLVEKVYSSKILSIKDDCIYWSSISNFSLPQEFATRILDAEEKNDALKLETYANFWTLMSLNPNEECRRNLFWFLNKWGLVIARCGFFVAYRNVVELKDGTFTDEYTHSFKIKLGKMVTMDRDKCDCNSEVSCSRGLHLGGAGWLERNYYGNCGLACLCNPAEVVAVPHVDNYGKLRTCAYLPIERIQFDMFNHVIPLNVDDGFDCSYVSKVIYEGLIGTEEDSPYKIVIPKVPEIDNNNITNRILEIAKTCITNRNV